MNAAFNPANATRAAEANAGDAANAEAEIDALIAWHEREQAIHARAIQTLAKAKSFSRVAFAVHTAEAATLRKQQEQQQ